jgi:hypothetical protein
MPLEVLENVFNHADHHDYYQGHKNGGLTISVSDRRNDLQKADYLKVNFKKNYEANFDYISY